MNRPPNFNRLARIYRWMEWASFGPWLGHCRTAFLSEAAGCSYGTVLGDGDGRFAARLLAGNPGIRIDAVDASAAMLKSLAHRAGKDSARVRTHLADARCWPAAAGSGTAAEGPCYDLIATHFFLDCLTGEEIESLATRLRRFASPGAIWLVSEFAIPRNLFGRLVAQPVVSGLYLAFATLTGLTVRTLPDHSAALRDAGFTIRKRRMWMGGLLVSELWVPDAAYQAYPPPKSF
jgi:SAM-dependent methyltransferase